MTVIASNLSNFPRMQQRDDQGDEQPGQDRVRYEDFAKQQHRAAQNRSGRSSA